VIPTFETLFAGIIGFYSAVFGSRYLAVVVEDTDGVPKWVGLLIGPVGALVGMIVAIWWLSSRLNKAEVREEARRVDRESLMKTVIELSEQTKAVIEANTKIISKVDTSLSACQMRQQIHSNS